MILFGKVCGRLNMKHLVVHALILDFVILLPFMVKQTLEK